MAVKLIDFKLIYGVAGAREKFEDLCAHLIHIAGPLVDPTVDGDMGWMAPVIPLPFIGVKDRVRPRTFPAMRSAHVRLSSWSHTQKRCSPVSRDSTLMMGGRPLA